MLTTLKNNKKVLGNEQGIVDGQAPAMIQRRREKQK
jgi:hypothetical protein